MKSFQNLNDLKKTSGNIQFEAQNNKGPTQERFLEAYVSDDDSEEIIVDPGKDDFFCKASNIVRPYQLYPDMRRARI